MSEKTLFFNEPAFLPCPQEGMLCFVSGEEQRGLLAALCSQPDHQCQRRSSALPLVAAEKVPAVPDLPDYGLQSLAPEKAEDQHFLLSIVCKGSLSPRHPTLPKRPLQDCVVKNKKIFSFGHSLSLHPLITCVKCG